MPELKSLQDAYADEIQVYIVGTGGTKRLTDLRADRAPGVPMPISTDAFLAALGLEAFPETLILDAQGRVAEHLRQGEDFAYFAARVDALLLEGEGEAMQGGDGEIGAPSPGAAGEPGADASADPGAAEADRGRHGIVSRVVFRYLEWRKR